MRHKINCVRRPLAITAFLQFSAVSDLRVGCG